MSSVSYDGTPGSILPSAIDPRARADAASRRWRTVWRIHFYAGIFSAPFLVMLALTGLVILYTQPINDALQRDRRVVSAASTAPVSLGGQRDAVMVAYPDHRVTSVVVPRNSTTSTSFGLDDGREVFVNPYTGIVLGDNDPGRGLVALANRLHGSLNNEQITVPIPHLAGVFGDEPFWKDAPLGDVVLEVFATWGLVLASSGIYLWWPRKRDANKALFLPRLRKKGRARWRDLHAVPGFALSFILAFFVISGMPWSSSWGGNFSWLANEVTPNAPIDAPSSGDVTLGDLDRLGNKITWNTAATVVPDSQIPPALVAQVSLDVLAAAAADESMKPGYSISFPEDSLDEAGNAIYGAFTLSNSWPRKTGESRTVFVDQFTGNTLAVMKADGNGAVAYATDTLVSTHMGTQLGVVSRIVMTAGCVLVIWSVISATVMYNKRRRPGSVGLPRRPADLKLANRLLLIAVILAVVYPLWGLTALAVLAVDRFVIQRTSPLRRLFGQRQSVLP
jgi:uncharacterized iron-regulated membrane protein